MHIKEAMLFYQVLLHSDSKIYDRMDSIQFTLVCAVMVTMVIWSYTVLVKSFAHLIL